MTSSTVSRWCVCVATGLTASCGGGGSSASRSVEPEAAPAFRVSGIPQRTAFRSGTFTARFDSSLPSVQRVIFWRCRWARAPGSSCAVDHPKSSNLQISYADVTVGAHRLLVEGVDSDGIVRVSASQTLSIEAVEAVVHAGTPAGVLAAVALARDGHTVALIEPTSHVGGMVAGGLSKSDVGPPESRNLYKGLAGEFFMQVQRVARSRDICTSGHPCPSRFDVTPGIALHVFNNMVRNEPRIVLERSARLLSVERQGATLSAITTTRGTVQARVFIDASYEGDLLAAAGVPYRLGREARRTADPPDDEQQLAEQEDHAGSGPGRLAGNVYVDPHVIPGDPSSPLLPYVESLPDLPATGRSDSRVQAYNYRLCVTDDPDAQIPFEQPASYDPLDYELAARTVRAMDAAGLDVVKIYFDIHRVLRSKNPKYFKYDLNGGAPFSTDMTVDGWNQSYVEADEPTRQLIRERYQSWTEGLLYAWRTDERFPASLRNAVRKFGLCSDEFMDNGNWPNALYVRVARRMEGAYVMNENDLLQNGRRAGIRDVIGFGTHYADHHRYRYFSAPTRWPGEQVKRNALWYETTRGVYLPDKRPYPIAYRSLTPRAEDARNLLVPVALSATSVAQASIRMEPVLMVLGHSAGVAAALALETNQSVQDVDYAKLRNRLIRTGQKLSLDE